MWLVLFSSLYGHCILIQSVSPEQGRLPPLPSCDINNGEHYHIGPVMLSFTVQGPTDPTAAGFSIRQRVHETGG